LSDIERISEERSSPRTNARDSKFRLLCGASIAMMRTPDGKLDFNNIIEHVGALVDEGLDVAAVSTAHGFTEGVGSTVRELRKAFPELTLIGGNVTNGAGVEYLAECGADAIKIGQGPGSICSTRIVAGVGIPQLTALYVCSKTARKLGVRTIADGGITKSGDMVKALTLADAMICGGLLAGCPEAPGQVMEINGKMYKQYRGMGSLAAMKAGSAARYGHDFKVKTDKVTAEGVEALKEVSSSLDDTLRTFVGGIQSGMGYLGARTLEDLRKNARFTRLTGAGQKESAPHDIIEIKNPAK
jgi:IMP dehydrogenase